MKKDKLTIALFSIFILFLGLTIYTGLGVMADEPEVIVKKSTIVYDKNSGVVVNEGNITFNDKNQTASYKVLLENTQDYDVKISDIKLSTPTEEFLKYEKEYIEDLVIKANDTKEVILSLETTGIKGWGRNFNDVLTANISFEKLKKDEPKEIPELPAVNTEELITKTEVLEVLSISNNIIEFKDDIKVEKGDKVAVWIYSEPTFLGYFNVIEENGTKRIEGLEKAIKEANIRPGEHNIVLTEEAGELLGYISVYINNNQEMSPEVPKTEQEEKDTNLREETIVNPNTRDKDLIVVLGLLTTMTGMLIIIVSKNKISRYAVIVIALGTTLTTTNAEDLINIPLTINVSFNSQNVMKDSGCDFNLETKEITNCEDYWVHADKIKNFYIENEIKEISEYKYQFDVTEKQIDVTEKQKGRVKAYLVPNKDNSTYYDLYLQADGIIYANENASMYFAEMTDLEKIDNLPGIDTSKVTNMLGMFHNTGKNSRNFSFDLSHFDTSNVTNMMRMFFHLGYSSEELVLDLSSFNTSKVTTMKSLFEGTGYKTKDLNIDLSNFDTSKVTDMSYMFKHTGYSSDTVNLAISNLDTSNVTTMKNMFTGTGYMSDNFTLDVSNFNTSKVTTMHSMFIDTGKSSEIFTLDVSNFDTSNVTDMSYMFYETGHNSKEFSLDLSNFDTSKVTNTNSMFFYTGYESNKINTSITIKNPNLEKYSGMFGGVAYKPNTKIVVNYTKETESIVDNIIKNKGNLNIFKGVLIVDVDNLYTGDEIHISGEKFNVISQTDDTVTMLAQYNLGTNYRQSTTSNYLTFSNSDGWEYIPGPKEIETNQWSTNPKTYINEYIGFLKIELKDNSVSGELITLKELGTLDCIVPSNYKNTSSPEERSCKNSIHKEWLVNGQYWWTRSAYTVNSNLVWIFYDNGGLGADQNSGKYGIRPVITISKDALRKLNS